MRNPGTNVLSSELVWNANNERMTSDIASSTLRALRRVLRATEIGSRQLAVTTGLTTSQWLVLREIDARNKTTPGVIAQALQFSQATITTIVDRLVALNLVQRQRNASDKRQFLLTATDAADVLDVEKEVVIPVRTGQQLEDIRGIFNLASCEEAASLALRLYEKACDNVWRGNGLSVDGQGQHEPYDAGKIEKVVLGC